MFCDTTGIEDPVLKAVEKYKKHPSIEVIRSISKNSSGSFQEARMSFKSFKRNTKLRCSKGLSGH